MDHVGPVDNWQTVGPTRPIDVSAVSLAAVRTTADFARCLDQVRMLAGPLSHRAIESCSGGRLHRTKIGQVLRGELPHRDFLDAYLEVCGVPEKTSEVWRQVWERLVAIGQNTSGTITADDPVVLKSERDAARAQLQRLTDELTALRSAVRPWKTWHNTSEVQANAPSGLSGESVLDELRTLRVERETANRRAQHAIEMYETAVRRLRATEKARDEAAARVEELYQQLQVTVHRLDEAKNEVTALREQLGPPNTANGHKRPTYTQNYTQKEAEILYGATDMATRATTPVIGDQQPSTTST